MKNLIINYPTEYVNKNELEKNLYEVFYLTKEYNINYSELKSNRKYSLACQFLKKNFKNVFQNILFSDFPIKILAIYNINEDLFLDFYLKNFFKNNNPLEIEDIKSFYQKSIETSLVSFFENFLKNNLILNLKPKSINHNNFIYDYAINTIQLDYFLKKYPELRKINQNFKFLTKKLTFNDFQKFYGFFILNENITDPKILVLRFNSQEKTNLENFRLNFPLLYQLILSIKIKESVTKIDQETKFLFQYELKDFLYQKLYNKVSFSPDFFTELVASKITNSVLNGSYLDPITLKFYDLSKEKELRSNLMEFFKLVFKDI